MTLDTVFLLRDSPFCIADFDFIVIGLGNGCEGYLITRFCFAFDCDCVWCIGLCMRRTMNGIQIRMGMAFCVDESAWVVYIARPFFLVIPLLYGMAATD